MDTRWTIVDGVTVEIPADSSCADLREAFRKPDDALLIAVTGDLLSVVHDEQRPLSELIAGCAEQYYFWCGEDRPEISNTDAFKKAVTETDVAESTVQRHEVDH